MYLDLSQDKSHPESLVNRDFLVKDQHEQVHYLRSVLNGERDANRKNHRIIATLTQRILQLEPPRQQEAPSEAPGGHETASEKPERPLGRGKVQESAQPRSWWYRCVPGMNTISLGSRGRQVHFDLENNLHGRY